MRTFLGFVFILFIGLLAATWYLAAKADPVLLDQQGRPIAARK